MDVDQLWLDKIPLDLCVRIAYNVKKCDQPSAVHLAKASSAQLTAVKHAMTHQLQLFTPKEARPRDNDSNEGSGDDDSHEGGSSRDSDERGSGDQDQHDDRSSDGGPVEDRSCDDDVSERSGSDHDFPEGNSSKEDPLERNSSNDEPDQGNSVDDKSSEGNDFDSKSDAGNSCDHESDAGNSDDDERDSEKGSSSNDDSNEDTFCFENLFAGNSSHDESNIGEIVRHVQKEFAALFRDDVQEILLFEDPVEFLNDPMITACWTAPSLSRLILYQFPDNIYSVPHGENVRELDLGQCESTGLIPLLRGLSDLPLRILRITTKDSVCLHKQLTNDPENHSLLAEWFPQVEELFLLCNYCGGNKQPPSFLWRAMEKFKALKKVAITEYVPEDAVEKLSKIDRVSLITGNFLALAEKIPDRIFRICSSQLWSNGHSDSVIRGNQLERLAACDILEELDCSIRPGVEAGLVRVAGNLRTLNIAFENDESERVGEGEAPVPLKPKPGAFLDVVKSAPFLISLDLMNMRIDRGELQEILKAAGKRLESFGEQVLLTTWIGQFLTSGRHFMLDKSDNKHELEAFAAILRTAALNNPKLKQFNLDVRPEWFTDPEVLVATLPQILASFEVLQRRAMALDIKDIERVVQKFRDESIGMLEIISTLTPNVPVVFYP